MCIRDSSRNVRQVSRDLDALAGASSFTDKNGALDPRIGIDLSKTGHREAGGKLFFQTMLLDFKLPAGLPQGKADNQILGVVQSLREQHPGREVVLVSKDINMRVKARALGPVSYTHLDVYKRQHQGLRADGVQIRHHRDLDAAPGAPADLLLVALQDLEGATANGAYAQQADLDGAGLDITSLGNRRLRRKAGCFHGSFQDFRLVQAEWRLR